MKSPSGIWARRAVISALVLAGLASIAGTAVLRIPRMMPLNYVEGFNLLDALRVAAGEELFGDPAEPPWTIHVYTPFYTWVHSILADPGNPSLVAGRLVSYLALLLGAVAIAVSTPRASRPWAVGIAALYLTMPLLAEWGALVRPDNLAVLFSLLGVLTVMSNERRAGLLLAAAFFFLAFFSKQSTLAGLIASTLYLAGRNRRAAVLLAGATSVLGGVAVIWMQVTTEGWFLFHTVTGNLNPFDWRQLGSIHGAFLRDHFYLVIAGGVLSGSAILDRRFSLPFLWFGVAVALTVSAGKIGSDANYFLEPLAALTLFAAREIPIAIASLTRTRRRRAVATLCALGLLAAAMNVGAFFRRSVALPAADEAYAEIVRGVAALPAGAIVSDDGALLVYTNRPLVFRPFVMTQLANTGRWDERPFVEQIAARELVAVIPVVVPEERFVSRYTAVMRQTLMDHYRPTWTFHLVDSYRVFVPVD